MHQLTYYDYSEKNKTQHSKRPWSTQCHVISFQFGKAVVINPMICQLVYYPIDNWLWLIGSKKAWREMSVQKFWKPATETEKDFNGKTWEFCGRRINSRPQKQIQPQTEQNLLSLFECDRWLFRAITTKSEQNMSEYAFTFTCPWLKIGISSPTAHITLQRKLAFQNPKSFLTKSLSQYLLEVLIVLLFGKRDLINITFKSY